MPGSFYERVRAHGSLVVLLSLVLCLALRSADVVLWGGFLLLCLAASRLGSIGDSIRHFNREYRLSACGTLYVVFVLYLAANLLVVLYHGDQLKGIETALVRLLIAYTILYHVARYDLNAVFLGAAIGGLVAGLIGAYDFFVLDLERAGGVTNPIRFGMLAALFGMISLGGFLFANRSRLFSGIMLAGILGGFGAATLSGSRGVLVAVPLMVLVLLPRFRGLLRPSTSGLLVAAILIAVPLGGLQAGRLGERTAGAVADIAEAWQGGEISGIEDDSVRDRVRMLEIAADLFQSNPLLGVGSRGWQQEIDRLVRQKAEQGVAFGYNQAHNQFANDFAKGGIVWGLAGLALLFVPMVLFARSNPYGKGEASLAALLGLITTAGFAGFCLTESVMILSIPSAAYAILVTYLMAATMQAQDRSAA